MLAGDVFDSLKVWGRIKAFQLVYMISALFDWRNWRSERKYRLEQARLQFTGGDTPLDKV
jgi:hypothetical protein